jgi:2-polyprenyl-6-methoxyphenol hydroxylase-like FAD-dependent oxidoreductase
MTQPLETQVLIIGAGPVGLSLAIALTRLSVPVRIIDKSSATKHQPRACVIWSRSEEVLRDLGIIQSFAAESYGFHGAAVYTNGQYMGELSLGNVPSPYPYPMVIEQHETERLLVEELAALGVHVEFNTEATNLRFFANYAEVTVTKQDGIEAIITCAWVVGCEGTRSLVRETLAIPFEGERRSNLQAVQVNAVPTWRYPTDKELVRFFLAPNVSLMVIPIPGGGCRFFAFTIDPDPSRKDPPTLKEMQTLIAETADARELQLDLTEPVWLNRARFQDRIAATLWQGRALLAGDAAHAWAPVGGHGMNTGIRGAHNLAWKLAAVQNGTAKASLLDTYSDEQRSTAQEVMNLMRFNLLELPLPKHGLWAVQAILPMALSIAPIKQWIDWTLSDLGMHYRQSSLSWQRIPNNSLHSGDRVPDVSVTVNSDSVSLHHVLAYDRWTLIVNASSIEQERLQQLYKIISQYQTFIHVQPLVPANREAERALGQREQMILIRPDGHVGLLTHSHDLQTLEDYLDTFLIRI